MKSLAECRLYTFVDAAYLRGRSPESVARSLCDGGSDLIQLRAKGSPVEEIRDMAGAIVPITMRAGVYLVINDHPQLADETGALLLVHPGIAPGDEVPAPYPDNSVYRLSGLALQASVSQMGITLMYGDLLDAYPNVAVHLVNLGGTLPFILERLEGIASSRNLPGAKPGERLRRLYFDCASLGPRALELAVKVIGADRIMLGTDYPIFRPNPVQDVVAKAEISDADRALVSGGTAQSIIDRLA